jgi:hypothetical protein
MKKIYLHTLWFWFVLLLLAIINGIIRDATYKPLLEPIIGNWAHQLSSITGILLFFCAIYLFLKYINIDYTKRDLWNIGVMWLVMTIIFEFAFGYYVRDSSWSEMLGAYYFWKGELWIFVLISVVIIPQICFRIINNIESN